jgi:hypothetical protein
MQGSRDCCWVSGGYEWSVGIRGHRQERRTDVLTCYSPLFRLSIRRRVSSSGGLREMCAEFSEDNVSEVIMSMFLPFL